MRPDVMLFDEVTAALDPETVKEVLVTIRQLAEEGMTCILVTHEMGFAREIADHIYFTDRGVIVEHGPPATFFKEAKDPDRKSVVSGKSVSVRVDIGGRRIIKKKNNTKSQCITKKLPNRDSIQ